MKLRRDSKSNSQTRHKKGKKMIGLKYKQKGKRTEMKYK